jgi:hypothetical protein
LCDNRKNKRSADPQSPVLELFSKYGSIPVGKLADEILEVAEAPIHVISGRSNAEERSLQSANEKRQLYHALIPSAAPTTEEATNILGEIIEGTEDSAPGHVYRNVM